jgi:hypothetical protein
MPLIQTVPRIFKIISLILGLALVLFHHDPTYNGRKLYKILQSARWYTERMNINGLKLTLATEGLEIRL